jgi:hypothetical protein
LRTDIDFLTGFLLMKAAIPKKGGSLRDRLWRLADAGVLTKTEASDLDHAAELLRTAEHVACLVAGRSQKWLPTSQHAGEACQQWVSGILRRPFPNGLSSVLQETMQVVREISSQTAEGSTATSTSIAKLAALSAQLRKSVAGFRLPDFGAGTTTVGAPPPALPPAAATPPMSDPVSLSNSGRLRKASGVGA